MTLPTLDDMCWNCEPFVDNIFSLGDVTFYRSDGILTLGNRTYYAH